MKKLMVMVVLVLSCQLFGTTWYVDDSSGLDSNGGTTSSLAMKTIQAAIDVAKDGDVVIVAAGTYDPFETSNKSIRIEGVSGARKTIIDGHGVYVRGNCLNLSGASYFPTNTVVIGFTIQHLVQVVGGTLQQCIVQENNSWSIDRGACVVAVVENCLLLNNRGKNGAAADGCILRNCTMVGNVARDLNYVCLNSVLENCVVYGNGNDERGTWQYWFYQNPLVATVDHRERNVYVGNPGFVDPDNGDYHLCVGSPCIDAGDNSYVTGGIDFDGNTRIVNGTVDIGCYEFDGTLCSVVFDLGSKGVYVGGGALKQHVKNGDSAAAPVVNSYVFTGWDKKFDNVTGSMTVTAQYIETNCVVEVTNVVTRIVETTNVVEVTKVVEVTNYIDVVQHGGTTVSLELTRYEPERGFEGGLKHVMNGIVYDARGAMCGLSQISTAKATAKGVKISGFVMLDDGKKQSLKAVTAPLVNGKLEAETKAGKIGMVALVVGADGFKGVMDNGMTMVSADIGSDAGVLSGSLTLNCFDAKAKIKKNKIAVSGVAAESFAEGTVVPKNSAPSKFTAALK